MHVHPYDAPFAERADLDEVTELVDEPQPVTAHPVDALWASYSGRLPAELR